MNLFPTPSEVADEIFDDAFVAIHESSHAVGCLAQGIPFTSLSIIPDSTSAGRIITDPPLPDAKRCTMLLAGSIGVDYWFQSRWIRRDSMPDWTNARILNFFPSNTKPVVREPVDAATAAAIDAYLDRLPEDERLQLIIEAHQRCSPEEAATCEKIISTLARAAEKLVRRRWTDVQRIAAALLEKKTLTYSEVVDLLAQEPAA